jgi:hypothetical protein
VNDIPGPVRLARLRLEAQANDDNEIGRRDAVEMLSAVVTEYESLFELSRAERQRHVQRWYEQDQAIRELREELRVTVAALKLELQSANVSAHEETCHFGRDSECDCGRPAFTHCRMCGHIEVK